MKRHEELIRRTAYYVLMLFLLTKLTQCSPPPSSPSRRGQRWGVARQHENVTLLSAIGGSSEYPAWSPDGTRIAFQHIDHRFGPSDDISPRDIYVMNSDGTGERCLTCEAVEIHCEHPSWSPDSQRLLASCQAGDDYDLYVVDVTTGTLSRLTNYTGDERYPAWSPDGTQIMFLSKMDIETGRKRAWGYDVYTTIRDGANLDRLAEGAWYGRASWSPDGQQVSVTLKESYASMARLCIMDSHGLVLTCNDNAQCWNSAWSPDGSQIACVSGSKILAISIEDNRVNTLLDVGHRSISGISWAPDGTRLVITAGVMTMAANDLYVLELEP